MISCVCSPLKECFRGIFVIHCPAENKRDLEHSDLEIWHHVVAGAIFSVLYEVKVAAVWGMGECIYFFGISPSKKTTGINTVSVFVFCFLYTATLFSGPGPNVSCHILVHSKWSKRGFAEGPRDANNHGASAVNSNANILRRNPFV